MNEWMDGWIDGHRQVVKQTNKWMDGYEKWIDIPTDE